MQSVTFWLAMFGAVGALASEDFPRPLSWGANLEKVQIQDVIPEFSPRGGLAESTETRFKKALLAKGLFAGNRATDFAVLTPSVICNIPYGAKTNESRCLVELYLREHAPPPDANKVGAKRVAWGLVGTYYGRYTTTFPPNREILGRAIDGLLEDFLRAAAGPQKEKH